MLLVARDAALFDGRVGGRRDVQKCLLAENRLVALQPVAIEGVPPVARAHVRIFAAAAVAIPLRHGDVPAVRRWQEHFLRGRKNFRRGDFLPGFGVGTAAQFAIGGGRSAGFGGEGRQDQVQASAAGGKPARQRAAKARASTRRSRRRPHRGADHRASFSRSRRSAPAANTCRARDRSGGRRRRRRRKSFASCRSRDW